jgi:predicted ester cyclase
VSVVDVANMHYAEFNSRTFNENARKYVDSEVVIVDGPSGAELHGVAGYLKYANIWVAAFPDGMINVIEQRVSGNIVITDFMGQGTFSGVLQAPSGPIAGGGQALQLPFREQLEIKNGKIARSFIDYDARELMHQLGLG